MLQSIRTVTGQLKQGIADGTCQSGLPIFLISGKGFQRRGCCSVKSGTAVIKEENRTIEKGERLKKKQ
jgi:autotransporter adhesin